MTSPIITEAIRVLVDRRDLTRIEAAAAMEAIMSGAATNVQIAAFLTALRMKGETVEELIGFAQVMRDKVARVPASGEVTASLTGTDREMLIDTCGIFLQSCLVLQRLTFLVGWRVVLTEIYLGRIGASNFLE